MKTRFYLDTEFIEDGRTIDLISIGVVCEDGREFYAEVDGVDWSKASNWVLMNVWPHLQRGAALKSRATIASELHLFVECCGPGPEFWAYFADYDWVVLCQLFGTMMQLPPGWPKYCMDLKQLAVSLGDPRIPKQMSGEHHALADARWVKASHEWLIEQCEPPRGRWKLVVPHG